MKRRIVVKANTLTREEEYYINEVLKNIYRLESSISNLDLDVQDLLVDLEVELVNGRDILQTLKYQEV